MDNTIRSRAISELVRDLPHVAQWPEIVSLFPAEKDDSPVRLDWQLPVLACRSVGGASDAGLSAAAAIACLQISIILTDDMLDHDPRGEHHRLGWGRTANLSLALQAGALALITRASVPLAARAAASEVLALAALGTSHGQELDVQNLHCEEDYWRVVRAKSTPFYGAAFQIGALLGGAEPQLAQALYRFGALLGEMIQVFDDLEDAFEVPANADWHEGRNNLALLYAGTAEHSERGALLELLASVSSSVALAEAQQILIRSGAVSFCVYQWIERYRQARAALAQLDLHDPTPLRKVLTLQVDPLVRWLPTVGVFLPPDVGDLEQ